MLNLSVRKHKQGLLSDICVRQIKRREKLREGVGGGSVEREGRCTDRVCVNRSGEYLGLEIREGLSKGKKEGEGGRRSQQLLKIKLIKRETNDKITSHP